MTDRQTDRPTDGLTDIFNSIVLAAPFLASRGKKSFLLNG